MNARLARFLLYFLATSPHWIVAFLLYPAGYGKMPFVLLSLAVLIGLFVASQVGGSDKHTAQETVSSTSLAERVLMGALFAYPAILLICGLFGVDPYGSFFGEQARQNGVLTVMAMVALAFCVKRFLKQDAHQHMLARVVLWGASIAALVAVLESLFPNVRASFGEAYRYSAWFGNPNFLASYLAVAVSFSSPLLFRGSKIERIISGVLVVLCMYGVVVTGSRGGLLGLFAGLGCIALIWIVTLVRRDLRRARTLVPTVLVVLLVGVFVARLLIPASAISRLVSPDVWLAENRPRLLTWQIAWEGFLERPISGWGTDQFRTVFDRFYKPELLSYSFYETVSDKAHNQFIELLATTGVLGFFSFFVIIFSTVWVVIQRLRAGGTSSSQTASTLGVLAATIVCWLFLFDIPPAGMLFFISLGLLLVQTPSVSSNTQQPTTVRFRGLRILSSVTFCGLLVYLAVHGGVSSFFTTQAIDAMVIDPEKASHAIQRVAGIRGPYVRENALHVSYEFLRHEGNEQWSDEVARGAAVQLRDVLASDRRSTTDFTSQFVLGQLHTVIGLRGGTQEDFDRARSAFDRARILSPKRQAVIFQTGHLLLAEGKVGEAVSLLAQQVVEDSENGESHWFYALALAEDGQDARSADAFHEAIQRGRWPKNLDESNYVIRILNAEERWDDIIGVYQQMLSANPRRADLRAFLAATYAKAGKPELAIIEARRAAELDPSFSAEAEVFIHSLENAPE